MSASVTIADGSRLRCMSAESICENALAALPMMVFEAAPVNVVVNVGSDAISDV